MVGEFLECYRHETCSFSGFIKFTLYNEMQFIFALPYQSNIFKSNNETNLANVTIHPFTLRLLNFLKSTFVAIITLVYYGMMMYHPYTSSFGF